MPVEIERKFLVVDDAWRDAASRRESLVQGYLAGPPAARCSVRVRIEADRAWLNIKSLQSGIRRDEYEYPIPADEARRMIETLAGRVVEKVRHHVHVGAHVFEVDAFAGANAGLVVAEVELASEHESFERPAWLGREVSHLARYYNLNLAEHPYECWSAVERNAADAA